MTWRFRKSIRLLPGLRLNIGKRGITSATIGPGHGVDVTVNRDKIATINVGIPGSGLSWRQRLGRIFSK